MKLDNVSVESDAKVIAKVVTAAWPDRMNPSGFRRLGRLADMLRSRGFTYHDIVRLFAQVLEVESDQDFINEFETVMEDADNEYE